MASVRSLDNALTLTWPDGSTAPITKDDGSTMIPDAGRIMRNLIHGADTVMSHITHFYALAALDYVDASILGPNWDPTYAGATPGLLNGVTTIMPNGNSVAGNYVESLTMRRKMHTASAILSGRHPHSNAIVPGGVTTLLSTCDLNTFSNLLDQVRNFINTAYIPDVLTVATLPQYTVFWTLGTNPGNLLSYGDFPIQTSTNAERLLLERGIATAGTLLSGVAYTAGPTAFLANVREYVGYSYYDAGFGNVNDGLNPSVGVTKPDVSKVTAGGQHYSWLKAPRYDLAGTPLVCEVGPLARVHNTVFQSGGATVSEAKSALTTDPTITVQPCAPLALGATYTLANLVTAVTPAIPGGAVGLVSYLGRHGARALECKYIADAMAATGSGDQEWLQELNNLGPTASPYVYAKIPKKIALGAGWAEAPRGALGHWITIDKKRVASYQCVVPTTWNHGPRDTAGTPGPAEQGLIGVPIGTDSDSQVLNTIRGLHTYDFCIACAVHLVRPDGSTIAKVKLDTDGQVTRLPNDAEI